MANIPKDSKLYDKVKKRIYLKYPQHSAYRSGILVKEYKKEYYKKHKSNNAYEGKKNKLSERQLKKRQRLIKHTKKSKK